MENKAKHNLDARLEIRLTKADKERYNQKARTLGIGLSELVLSSLEATPVAERWDREKLFDHIWKLTKEMNLIGRNINQATVAIHQIKNSEKMEDGEFREYNRLIRVYMAKQEAFKEMLDNILRNNPI
jgi:hypothetical protein